MLEALLHCHANAHQLSPGGLDDVDEALHGIALGHEVVDDQHPVLGTQPLLGHDEGHFFLIGIGEDLALIQAALDIVALGLLGEHHGNAVFLGTHRGQRDAAGLRRQHHGDVLHIEILGELIGQLAHKGGVHPVIQETVHLDDVAGQDLTFPADALLQQFHKFLL